MKFKNPPAFLCLFVVPYVLKRCKDGVHNIDFSVVTYFILGLTHNKHRIKEKLGKFKKNQEEMMIFWVLKSGKIREIGF